MITYRLRVIIIIDTDTGDNTGPLHNDNYCSDNRRTYRMHVPEPQIGPASCLTKMTPPTHTHKR